MANEEQLFIKGFNTGYLISKHQPELFEKLESSLKPENPFMNGLKWGKREMELEKAAPSKKSKEIQKNKDRDIDRER